MKATFQKGKTKLQVFQEQFIKAKFSEVPSLPCQRQGLYITVVCHNDMISLIADIR